MPKAARSRSRCSAGNTADPATLGSTNQEGCRKSRFGIERVVFVGDRGMLTSMRIDTELRDVEGPDWITKRFVPTASRFSFHKERFSFHFFDERDLAEVKISRLPQGTAGGVSQLLQLPRSEPANGPSCWRRTEKLLDEIVAATQRRRRPFEERAWLSAFVNRKSDQSL